MSVRVVWEYRPWEGVDSEYLRSAVVRVYEVRTLKMRLFLAVLDLNGEVPYGYGLDILGALQESVRLWDKSLPNVDVPDEDDWDACDPEDPICQNPFYLAILKIGEITGFKSTIYPEDLNHAGGEP